MKAKLGGLNSYLTGSASREKRQVQDDKDETSSRRSRRAQQNNRRRYDDLESDARPVYHAHKDFDVDNEEDYTHQFKQSARHMKPDQQMPTLNRANSRGMLINSSSARKLGSMEYGKSSGLHSQHTDHESGRHQPLRQASESDFENFQHMRQETKQCMEVLTRRVGSCLTNLNEVITAFRNNLRKMVEEEYNKLESMVMNIVESTFSSELENVRKLCKAEEKKMGKSVAEVRDDLEQLYGRLQRMKEGVESHNWKTITGDFFKEDIEGQAQQLIKKSEKFQVGKVVHMHFDHKREEQFKNSLLNLLQVQLSTSGGTEDEGL